MQTSERMQREVADDLGIGLSTLVRRIGRSRDRLIDEPAQRQSISQVLLASGSDAGSRGIFPNRLKVAQKPPAAAASLASEWRRATSWLAICRAEQAEGVLSTRPNLILGAAPRRTTRAVLIAARAQIHEIVQGSRANGLVVLFCSSDPAETVDIAGRVAMYVDGELIPELSGDRLTEHSVVTLMNSARREKLSVLTSMGVER